MISHKIKIVIAALMYLTLQAGCSLIRAGETTKAADLAAIEAFNREYLQAINHGDIAALGRLTTEGHIMLPPNRPPIIGKQANDAANRRAFELFTIEEQWNPVETEVTGDWAYQRGTYSVRATPKNGGKSRISSGNFLRIYQRQPNGAWALIRDMFNSDQPPAAN